MTMANQQTPAGGQKQENQFRLLSERRFGPFFVAQLGGAFNDNVYKTGLVLMGGAVARRLSRWKYARLAATHGSVEAPDGARSRTAIDGRGAPSMASTAS